MEDRLTTRVSIVSMNRPEQLAVTIAACQPLDANPAIIDNGSTDSVTIGLLNQMANTVRFGENRGLSSAINVGLFCSSGAEILVHLDDDAVLADPGDLAGAIESSFESFPELGLIVPNAANYSEFIDRGGYREVRWALGFCWATRKSLWQQIGGYDEQLLHQQECDLAIRVRMAGYTVGALPGFNAHHNDPGGERSDLSKAREHLGCVQFRDKWTSYFRGCESPSKPWSYGTMPLYLMQHWPPDQEWYRRYAETHGVHLNPGPPPSHASLPPGSRLGLNGEDFGLSRMINIAGMNYLAYVDLRNDYGYWATGDGYHEDRQKAIDRWRELTGEIYTGYKWPEAVTRRLGA